MIKYPDQPEDREVELLGQKVLSKHLEETLRKELPYCRVNSWFVGTVHFANMVDRISEDFMRRLNDINNRR